jgi:hypothetical protein
MALAPERVQLKSSPQHATNINNTRLSARISSDFGRERIHREHPAKPPSRELRLHGEYIQMPIAMPNSAATTPIPEDQITTCLHNG